MVRHPRHRHQRAGDDYTAAGRNVIAAFAAGWKSYLSTATRITGVFLTIGTGGENYTLYVTPTTEQIGTSVAAKLPQNCAYLVQKITERAGRTGKGRCFLPGVAPEASVDDLGVINGTGITNAQAACDTWLDTLETNVPGVPMVLLHNEGSPGGTSATIVTALRIAPVIATQRRRLRR